MLVVVLTTVVVSSAADKVEVLPVAAWKTDCEPKLGCPNIETAVVTKIKIVTARLSQRANKPANRNEEMRRYYLQLAISSTSKQSSNAVAVP